MKRHSIKTRLLTLVLLLCFALVGCTPPDSVPVTEPENSSISSLPEESVDTPPSSSLTIYLPGILTVDLQADGSTENLYSSATSIGLSVNYDEYSADRGHLLYQILTDYADEHTMALEFVFFSDSRDIVAQLEKDKAANTLPDLVLFDKCTGIDLWEWRDQNLLTDLTPWMQQDSAFDWEQYLVPVLNSGKLGESFYALPYLFNLNGVITSKEFLQQSTASLPAEDLSYMDILANLEKCCAFTDDQEELSAIYFDPASIAPSELSAVLIAAARCNTAESTAPLDEVYYEKLLHFMQNYLTQEYHETNPQQFKRQLIQRAPLVSQDPTLKPSLFGCLLEGGYGGYQCYSSLLMQMWFMENYYTTQKQTPVLRALPTLAAADEYSANVTGWGVVLNSCEQPETAYEILKYLLNYDFPIWYGFPVSKEGIENQLQNAAETSYQVPIHYNRLLGVATDEQQQKNYEINSVWMDPLSAETVKQFRYMLDHVVGASLPDLTLTEAVNEASINYYLGKCTLEEAVQNCIDQKATPASLEIISDTVYYPPRETAKTP